ncbi:MAG TPA: hypothetical protein VFY23_09370 [Candidatus Limnocylindrales bacterium]|nr:hypothetical protein [Candidatus Limnocylindrales bacterium]
MATRTLVLQGTGPGSALDLGDAGRLAARAAAGLTVGSALALSAFFAVGEPWGTLNDTLSIGLAWSTVPIAVDLVRRHPTSSLLRAGVVADLAGVAATTVFTSLLISRRMTFEESLQPILTGQALIGTWLILAGAAARSDRGSRGPAMLGILGGAGLVATAAGIATGGMESPVAAIGFISAFVGTTGFYGLLGRRLAASASR